MTSLLRQFVHFLNQLDRVADKKTKGWFMTGSPIEPILVIIFYYQFVRKIGPALMESKKPYNLDKIIQVYNIVQVVLNGWLAFESFRITFGPSGHYKWTCEPMDTTMSPLAMRVVTLTWIYYMIKLLDLLDTVFFVLRKKFNQATFLHVYHHIGTIVMGYIGSKFYPDGHGFLIIPLNSMVHTVMYFYYFLSNYNSEYKKNIWWKKHITQIQIIQFIILVYHNGKVLFIPSCEYSMIPMYLLVPQTVLMLVLFLNFYKNAYLSSKKPLKDQ